MTTIKPGLFRLALKTHEADAAQERMKAEMRRCYRDRFTVEEIAETTGWSVPRVISTVGADRGPAPAPSTDPAVEAAK